ncbi:polysaccharide biosynthesis/export family protein [Arhodomonas sp. AD133]|uniref:polysaccharide biosynthesis/export family protein n=1 Tax=Arhodomonas sp. AD133 TaxID=3415009 RepID=UPI003EB6CCC1
MRSRILCMIVAVVTATVAFPGFASAQETPEAGESYALGPGDRVSITVAGSPEYDVSARVRDDGTIGVSYLGAVTLGGLTVREAERRIARGLLERGLLRDPQVAVHIEEFVSRQVTVMGQVKKPGRYGLAGPSTLLDLIARAGGVSAEGADYVVLVREGERRRLDLDGLTAGVRNPVTVRAGDVVTVPRMDVFYIEGAVNRSGRYRLEEGMTVMQAIAVGGGLTPRGSYARVEIQRRGEDGETQVLDAERDTTLRPNDLIHVKERIF